MLFRWEDPTTTTTAAMPTILGDAGGEGFTDDDNNNHRQPPSSHIRRAHYYHPLGALNPDSSSYSTTTPPSASTTTTNHQQISPAFFITSLSATLTTTTTTLGPHSSSSSMEWIPDSTGGERSESQRCAQMNSLFSGLNVYFRDDDIVPESEHSSVLAGSLIVLAYSIVIMFGAIGNLLTIAAVLRNRTNQMRTVRNFFIVNLALSDFFICTITAPTTLYTVLFVFWPHGVYFCKVAGMLQGFNIFLSTFSITAIALDRYVLVIFPTKRQRQQRLSLALFTSMWLISIVLALPLFVASDLNNVFSDNRCGISLQICQEKNERWEQMPISKGLYTVGVLVFQYAFPLASIVFAYSRIAHRMGVRKSFASINGPGGPAQRSCSSSTGSNLLTTALLNNLINGGGVAVGSTMISATQQGTRFSRYSIPFYFKHKASSSVSYYNNAQGSAPSSVCSALIDLRKKSIQDRNRRTNFLLITLVAVFATAWLPLNIFHLVNTLSESASRSFSVPIFALCHVIAICSACLNPVSYAFFNKNFRNEFIVIARSVGLTWLYERCAVWIIRQWTGLVARSRGGSSSGCSAHLVGVGNGNGIIKNGGGGGGGMGNNRTTPPAVANGKPHLFAVKNMTLSRRPCLYARESVRGGVAASGAFRKISGVPPPPLPQPRDAVSGTARVRVQTMIGGSSVAQHRPLSREPGILPTTIIDPNGTMSIGGSSTPPAAPTGSASEVLRRWSTPMAVSFQEDLEEEEREEDDDNNDDFNPLLPHSSLKQQAAPPGSSSVFKSRELETNTISSPSRRRQKLDEEAIAVWERSTGDGPTTTTTTTSGGGSTEVSSNSSPRQLQPIHIEEEEEEEEDLIIQTTPAAVAVADNNVVCDDYDDDDDGPVVFRASEDTMV